MGGDLFWNQLAVVLAVVAIISVGTWAVARGMGRGDSGGSVHANPLGAMDEVFHPAAHRAREELRHVDEVTDIVPSPDGSDPEGSLQLSRAPDGSLRAARITRRR